MPGDYHLIVLIRSTASIIRASSTLSAKAHVAFARRGRETDAGRADDADFVKRRAAVWVDV